MWRETHVETMNPHNLLMIALEQSVLLEADINGLVVSEQAFEALKEYKDVSDKVKTMLHYARGGYAIFITSSDYIKDFNMVCFYLNEDDMEDTRLFIEDDDGFGYGEVYTSKVVDKEEEKEEENNVEEVYEPERLDDMDCYSLSYPNRYICDVVEEMERIIKRLSSEGESAKQPLLLGLAEIKYYGSRMEASLENQKDMNKGMKARSKLKDELKKLDKLIEEKHNELKDLHK